MKPRRPVSHGIPASDKLELFGYRLDDAPTHRRRNVTRIMQMVLTGALLIPSLVVILVPGFDSSAKQWAYGLTGTILGFWLKK